MSYEQFAYAYDRLMSDMPYSDWMKWIKNRCEDYSVTPKTAVDLGCGTGAITIPLAQEGMKVYGIDLSEDMLAIANDKAASLKFPTGGSIMWMQGDLRDWALPTPVDLALSICDCMNYLLEESEIEAAFTQVFQGLSNGGLFLFDVHAPLVLQTYASEQPFVLDEEDVSYIWTCELDETRIQIENDLSIFIKQSSGDYHKIEEKHIQRSYEIDFLKRQLERAGFVDIQITADFTQESPDRNAMRIFFAARKA